MKKVLQLIIAALKHVFKKKKWALAVIAVLSFAVANWSELVELLKELGIL